MTIRWITATTQMTRPRVRVPSNATPPSRMQARTEAGNIEKRRRIYIENGMSKDAYLPCFVSVSTPDMRSVLVYPQHSYCSFRICSVTGCKLLYL